MKKTISQITLLLFIGLKTYAQTQENATSKVPPILTTRAEENYSNFQKDSVDLFLENLKYIALDQEHSSFLTIGGEYRARMDHSRNISFGAERETSYLQRLNLHLALNIGQRIKLFTEFYHGLSSAGEILVQSDDIDFHQAFIDWKIIDENDRSVKIRLGRQEIGYGSSRLVGIRNGPNIRRSFDMAQLRLRHRKTKIDIFYGGEVVVSSGAFDNQSSLLDAHNTSPTLWGVYLNSPLKTKMRFFELYYLGFHSDLSAFSDVVGEETRHSMGLRSYGAIGKFTYNSELIFQFGQLANSDIISHNFETDWKYRLSDKGWKPQVGLKLDWSSGDRKIGDGKIGTFNPVFVNPGIYSLASVNTPANMTSLHPNFSFRPSEKLLIYLDYAFFYRTQRADGFYRPPRFLSRPGPESDEKQLGETFGILLKYEINRNMSFDIVSYYFISGNYLEETGPSQNIYFFAPTLSFKF